MRLAAKYPVSLVCRILEYPRSSYYYQAREPDDQALQEALPQVAATWPTYGYRRITIQLRGEGWWVNSKRIRCIMGELGFREKVYRKKRRTTNSDHPFPRYPNLVQGLEVVRPDQVWVGDITYVRLRREFVYLAVLLDVFTHFTEDEWGQAIERMEQAVDSGQLRSFTGNDYVEGLPTGDIVACEAWSGDVIALQYDNPDIKWVVPEEGLMIWTDNMLVPNKAEHKANAEAAMDFYYDPMNAAKLAAWVNYVCPVEGAQQAMEKVDSSLVDAPLIFPTPEFLEQTMQFMSLDEDTAQQYETDFSQAMG